MTLSSPISLMSDEHSELPTERKFKKRAWELKEEKGIKLTAALNELSTYMDIVALMLLNQN